jgi:hypothetical protein
MKNQTKEQYKALASTVSRLEAAVSGTNVEHAGTAEKFAFSEVLYLVAQIAHAHDQADADDLWKRLHQIAGFMVAEAF